MSKKISLRIDDSVKIISMIALEPRDRAYRN